MITGKIYARSAHTYRLFLPNDPRDDKFFQAKDELPQNRLTDSMILGACVDDDDDGAC